MGGVDAELNFLLFGLLNGDFTGDTAGEAETEQRRFLGVLFLGLLSHSSSELSSSVKSSLEIK